MHLLLLIPFILVLGLAGTVFWIWMLVDCGRRVGSGEGDKLGWLIAIAVTHFLGALLYFAFGRSRRVA